MRTEESFGRAWFSKQEFADNEELVTCRRSQSHEQTDDDIF